MAVQLFKRLIDNNGHLVIPAGTRKILPNTLMNCENLISVVIPKGVTVIGACSFLGCKNLKHVVLPEGLRTIDVGAFNGCTGLKNIVIPDGIRIIAHGAFKNCSGLTSIVIPDSVSVIGRGAFEGCTCLTDSDLALIAAKESDFDVVTISTTACVIGPKQAIVKVLNRAFHLFSSNRIVVEDDDSVEVMNQKIREACDRMEGDPDLDEQPAEYGAEFTLMDFLDDYNRMKSPCKDYVFSYIDDDCPDDTEDYEVELIDVTNNDDEYIVRILSLVYESQDSYRDEDWWDWCKRMVRLYGCRVLLQRESELYGSDFDDKDIRMFELDGDSVNMTILDGSPFDVPVRESVSNAKTEDDDIPF